MSDLDSVDDLLAECGIRLGEPRFLDDEDDPEVLRACLDRQRLAAWAAQRCRHERAVVTEIVVDPDNPLRTWVAIATPDGDRVKEMEVAPDLMRYAIAARLDCWRFHRFIDGLRERVEQVQAGDLTRDEAWDWIVERVDGSEAEGD